MTTETEQAGTEPTTRNVWRLPQIGRPFRRVAKWRKVKNAPQLENYRRDALETTIIDDQLLVDQACSAVDRKAKAAGLNLCLNPKSGLMDQAATVEARRRFVKKAYKAVRKLAKQTTPAGTAWHWYAVTLVHPEGLVSADKLTPELLSKIARWHQRRCRSLGVDSVEIGWIDLSRNRMADGTVLWSVHVHSVIGVIAGSPEAGKARIAGAYRVSGSHPDIRRPLDIRTTYLNRDFTDPEHSLAGWLAYGSRSARVSMNIQRDKRVRGAPGRPEKNTLRTTQIIDLLPFLGKTRPSNRMVLGNCRMGVRALIPIAMQPNRRVRGS